MSVDAFVADTHALLWHVSGSPLISGSAKQKFDLADRGHAIIHIPSVCLVEIMYLTEKGKIHEHAFDRLVDSLHRRPDGSYRLASLGLDTVRAMRKVPRRQISDLVDRIIVSTALELGLPLITKDDVLRRWDGVLTVW